MKNIKLIFSVFLLAMAIFSFVRGEGCTIDTIVDEYTCSPWQYCPSGQCICDVAWPWFVTSWNYCGEMCNYDSDTDEYICNNWQHCPLSVTGCVCGADFVSPWGLCGTSSSTCTYSWKTIFSWLSMQLYKTTTWACEQQTIQCDAYFNTNLSNSIANWYIYTWCHPSSIWVCTLPWGWTIASWSSVTAYQSSSVACGSTCVSQIRICVNWVLNWSYQYSSCSPSCGTSGGGWWWWWGGSSTPTCNFVDLVCVNWTYQKKPGVNCINWNVGNACSGTWISATTGNVATGAWLNPWKYDRIWDISNSPYSKELNLAYLYAYNMWITTMPNIFKADLEWKLIRSHMAKMMVQWSKKVLGVKANTGINCKFDDISYLKGQDLYEFVIQACQMWLMGVDNTWKPKSSFDPDGVVTRAQFGTVLSRAIRWEYYNGWDLFYNYHLEALNSVGIMKKISKPWDYELRGWVMLMLHRSHVMLSK